MNREHLMFMVAMEELELKRSLEVFKNDLQKIGCSEKQIQVELERLLRKPKDEELIKKLMAQHRARLRRGAGLN
jgi:hypothetical protein